MPQPLRRTGPQPVDSRPAGRFTIVNFLSLALLLILPFLALHRLGVNLRLAGPYVVLVSALSYMGYAVDKRRAQKGEWRVPENILHLCEILGGWPGAFVGQRRLRHKTSKISYQIFFWFTVFAYQFLAFDSLQNWRHSEALLHYLQARLR